MNTPAPEPTQEPTATHAPQSASGFSDTQPTEADRAILLTCDGRGKEAKADALARIIAQETAVKDANLKRRMEIIEDLRSQLAASEAARKDEEQWWNTRQDQSAQLAARDALIETLRTALKEAHTALDGVRALGIVYVYPDDWRCMKMGGHPPIEAYSEEDLSRVGPDLAPALAATPESAGTEHVDPKNLHRVICEASGYAHDEKDWRRDLCSLANFVAELRKDKERLDWLEETRRGVDTFLMDGHTHGHHRFFFQVEGASLDKARHDCRAAIDAARAQQIEADNAAQLAEDMETESRQRMTDLNAARQQPEAKL